MFFNNFLSDDHVDQPPGDDNHLFHRFVSDSALDFSIGQRDGFNSLVVRLARHADVRFRGQLFELKVPMGASEEAVPDGSWIDQAFRRIYRAEYGFDLPDGEPEVVNLRVVGLAAAFVSRYSGRAKDRARRATGAVRSHLPILERDGSVRDVPALDLAQAGEAREFGGPSVLLSAGATIWLPEGARARVADDGSVLISVA